MHHAQSSALLFQEKKEDVNDATSKHVQVC